MQYYTIGELQIVGGDLGMAVKATWQVSYCEDVMVAMLKISVVRHYSRIFMTS